MLGGLVVDSALGWCTADDAGKPLAADTCAISLAVAIDGCTLRRQFVAAAAGRVAALLAAERCVVAITTAGQALTWDDRSAALLGRFDAAHNVRACVAPASLLVLRSPSREVRRDPHGVLLLLDTQAGRLRSHEMDPVDDGLGGPVHLGWAGHMGADDPGLEPHEWTQPSSQSLGGFTGLVGELHGRGGIEAQPPAATSECDRRSCNTIC